jgi:hypothetical protein
MYFSYRTPKCREGMNTLDINVQVITVRFGLPFLVLYIDGTPTTAVGHNRVEDMDYRRFHHLVEDGTESNHNCAVLGGSPCACWDVLQPKGMSDDEWRRWEIVSLLEQAKLGVDEATIRRLIQEAREETQ